MSRSRGGDFLPQRPVEVCMNSDNELVPAWPIILTRVELDAIEEIHRVDVDTPRLEGPMAETILDTSQQVTKEWTQSEELLNEDFQDRMSRILDQWRSEFNGESETIVFASYSESTIFRLYDTWIRGRDNLDSDPVELSDEVLEGYERVKSKLENAENGTTIFVEPDAIPLS